MAIGVKIITGIIGIGFILVATPEIYIALTKYKTKMMQLVNDGKDDEAEKLSNKAHTFALIFSCICFFIAFLVLSGKIQ